MGRPTKLTPEVQHRILEAVAAGNTRKDAALYAGIGVGTLEDWIGRGRGSGRRPGHRIYVEFVAALEKAEAQAVVRNVAIIAKAAQDQWQAAAWWLERRRPEDWGRKDRVQADVQHQGQVDVTHHVDATEFNAILTALGYDPLGAVEPGGSGAAGGGD